MAYSYRSPGHLSRRSDRSVGEFPDHSRTTRSHAGEGLEDGYNFPGIILCALGIIALALFLTASGYGFAGWAIISGIAALVLAAAGVSWLLIEHRRVKDGEGLRLTDQRGH
ncbi:hypothetical protein [Nocardia mangyaensis]|uniref:hypothetical protein n=1 Tax=Nocardia mangyaensis TaxID=2213200 RepID=UPI001F0B0610|nr:hypothetical protein [Nocardia mangyaensis]